MVPPALCRLESPPLCRNDGGAKAGGLKRVTRRTHVAGRAGLALAAALAFTAPARADQAPGVGLNLYGMPGLIDMPSATPPPDGEIAGSLSYSDGLTRGTLAFQIAPRLTGAFRYAAISGFDAFGTETRYDRSFDLHFLLLEEKGWRPSVAVGLRDFVGTGLYGGEYIVASKTVGPYLTFTGGIGWGRLGSYGGFSSPFGADTRPGREDLGGEPNIDQWFRGDAAFFGGVAWQANKKITVKLEYSSDDYTAEQARGLIERKSPWNVGLAYAVRPGFVVDAYYLHGSELGIGAHLTLNPKRPPGGGDRSPAPLPVVPRAQAAASWDGAVFENPALQAQINTVLAQALATEGITLTRVELSPSTVRLGLTTDSNSLPQVFGRAARILAASLPATVGTFIFEPEVKGIVAARVVIRRDDLERLEFAPDNINRSLAATEILPGGSRSGTVLPQPRLSWGVGPYLSASIFDPDDPLRVDAGIEASASFKITPSLTLAGAVRQKLIGNRNDVTRVSDSALPHVRSDGGFYAKESFGIDYLTLEHFGRLSPDIYSRVTVGYLEQMYGGVSGELLWKPVDSRLAFGAEVNYVMQRDTDKLLGFSDYDYSVVTGHLSAYYDFASGYSVQVDAGRYLAGDYGATLKLERVFDNGWRVGAFATFTDVSFDDFGEGSFDKGITLTIPYAWFLGRPTRASTSMVLRPIQRDGGARLSVQNRLHEVLRDYHGPEMGDQWGRFWR